MKWKAIIDVIIIIVHKGGDKFDMFVGNLMQCVLFLYVIDLFDIFQKCEIPKN